MIVLGAGRGLMRARRRVMVRGRGRGVMVLGQVRGARGGGREPRGEREGPGEPQSSFAATRFQPIRPPRSTWNSNTPRPETCPSSK